MAYLHNVTKIQSAIAQLSLAKIIWADTEVADWNTKKPRLSLIQLLTDSNDLTGETAYILDVLDRPELIQWFIDRIMVNPQIEKVFHHSRYDLRFLGNTQARNVTCTLKLAKKISRDRLGVTNLKLKTLAAELCHFSDIDREEQSSDWGRRPLSEKQLHYAQMDVVYLAQVHHHLLNRLKLDSSIPKPQQMTQTNGSEPKAFSVTNVRVAFECPRLFYLGQRFGGMTLFLPPNQIGAVGNAFHDLAKQFPSLAQQDSRFETIFKPSLKQLNLETVSAQMQQIFYQAVFFPYLQESIKNDRSKASALHQIWQGLQGLIQWYAEILILNRRDAKARSVISQTFLGQEVSLQHAFELPDGTTQLVRGKLDSLILKGDRLCVVEYKTYEPADFTAQLVQVALYSYMLSQTKKQPIDSALYCVLSNFKAALFSWEDLEETFHPLIPYKLAQMRQWLTWEPSQPNAPPPTSQPDLCEICSQRNRCQRFFDETPTPFPAKTEEIDVNDRPPEIWVEKTDIDATNQSAFWSDRDKNTTPSSLASEVRNHLTPNPDKIAQQLVETLKSFKIDVDYLGAAVGPAFIRVKLKPHMGVKVISILNRATDLQVYLGIPSLPMISPQPGYISVDLPRRDRQVAQFEQYIQRQNTSPDAAVKIAIGIDLDGQLIQADLSDPNTCHFLVGGTTGSGKSEFLRSLLLSLLYRHSPDRLKIALVDPKRVTFPEFERMPWLYSPTVKDSDRAIALMTQLVEEMDSRYRRFELARCADIHMYNQTSTQPLPRIICIFDEYADFMAEKDIRRELELSIKRLGAMARAAGIHLIIATQRPEANVVTPIIRSNLPGRVALRTASEADSTIILGGKQTAAAYLLGKGDLLYQVGAQLQRLQSLFASGISPSDLR